MNPEPPPGSLILDIASSISQQWPVWAVWGMVAVMALFRIAVEIYQHRKLARSGIAEIDRMDGRTFERYLKVLFGKLGYRVELTRYIGDYGADLVARKNGTKTVIQAKRYKRSVGVRAIQEAVAAKGYYNCSAAMVVTNSTYTRQAVELAQANGVILWDRSRLVDALLSAQKAPAPAPTPSAPTHAPSTDVERSNRTAAPIPEALPLEQIVREAVCAICKRPVTALTREFCLSQPGRFGGQIFCLSHQQSRRGIGATPEPQWKSEGSQSTSAGT